MAKHTIKNASGQDVGDVELADSVFAGDVKPHLFHEVVTAQLAARRSGTASTKTRKDIRGGGAKPFRQKGTGRARQGTSRSPLMEGGGTVFGPHPRAYGPKVPKKVRKAAVRSALSLRREQGKLLVVDEIAFEEIKTKKFAALMDTLGVANGLFVLPERSETVERSARNIPGVKVLAVQGLNVYDILKYENLVIAKDALTRIEGVYA